MELIWDGIREAFRLIFTGDAEVYEITLLSLTVSGAATAIALVIGLSIASVLAFRAPPGRTLALSFLNSGMALPPVVVGLVVAGFGAAISEVGASIMVGGNIKGSTRTLTTATVLEVSRGNLESAMALAFILLALVYAVMLVLTITQQRRRAS